MSNLSSNTTKPDERRKVKDLLPGDMIDLEGDPYADPPGNPDALSLVFEYAVVGDVVPETSECIRIDTVEHGSFGFPPDHAVKVSREIAFFLEKAKHIEVGDLFIRDGKRHRVIEVRPAIAPIVAIEIRVDGIDGPIWFGTESEQKIAPSV